MPDTKMVDKSMGARHRAALGITEETDAVVVVVSEERGNISFCFNGNIVTNLDGASLRQALLGLFGQSARKRTKPAAKRAGTVSQTGTGSYRVTPAPGSAGEGRPRVEVMRLPGGPEGSGSLTLPPVPRGEVAQKSEREPAKPASRPMAPASPIETPKPVPAPETLPRPRED
jgi:diadenylate cyclase